MDWKRITKFLSSGQAFIPIYAANKGDSVQLLFKDGTIEILDMSCQSFLEKLLYYFGTSISANRNRYGKLVGRKQLVPIILSYGITLVPLNVRDQIGYQTRIGWFLAKEIVGFCKASQNNTFVQFTQHEINVMHSEKFCFEQLKNARCIELCYGEIHEPHRKNWLFSTG
jgi:hypothetical protein